MKKVVICLLPVLFVCTTVFSQATERIYIKGGSARWEELNKAVYLYPEFVSGLIEMKNGARFTRPLNYNRILTTIEFIDENKDTLALADESSVSQIIIGDDVFLFTPACLKSVTKGKVKLYVHERMKVGDIQKVGAFGIPNSGSSIENIEQIQTSQRNYDLDVNETIILSKATYYMVETDKHEFVQANRKNILKAAPGKEDQIKEYLKTNNVNFNKKDDVVDLVNYISGL